MSLFEKKFPVKDWSGKIHLLTAKQLKDRVLEDSKSNYNWIASATELVKVCRRFDFPEKYAEEIFIAILNCFAQLECKKEFSSHRDATDNKAVYFCYNSLSTIDEKAKSARDKYLTAVIEAVVKYHFRLFEFDHHGPTYSKKCEEWKKAMFEKYSSKQPIDFEELRKVLHDDFDRTMKTAESEGLFKEDDEKKEQEMKLFWSSIDLSNL